MALKGSFKHTDIAGANSFHFKDKKLSPGKYRLQVVATSSLSTGKPVQAPFTIERP